MVIHGDPTNEQWLSNDALPQVEPASTLVSTQQVGGEIGGPPYHQSLNDAIAQDCGLAGGTAYTTSDGKVGCVVTMSRTVEPVSSSQPPTIEPQPASADE